MTWSLRKKILLGFGLILSLLVVVLAWAIVNLTHLGSATHAILSENYRSILAAENMIDAIERQDSGILLYNLGFEEQGLQQFQENQNKFLEWFARAKDNITIEGEAEIIRRIDSSYAVFVADFTGFLRDRTTDDDGQAAVYHDVLLPAFMEVRVASAELRDLNQETMYAASEYAGDVERTATASTLLFGLFTIGLGIVISVLLTNRLARPIRELRNATTAITKGNYDVEVQPSSSDELGQLAGQFNEMTARLRAYRDLNVEQIVAEKRRSEAIIHNIDDGLLVIDADLDVLALNPAAERAFGIVRDEVEGRHFLEAVNDERLFSYLRQTVETGRSPNIQEEESFFTLRQRGEERHYQVSVSPINMPSHAAIGAILLLRDVTKLRELDRMKSEFVATASHELKTPLTGLGMSIELLQERLSATLGQRERALLDAAAEDVARLRALVFDLLDLSRIEAGKIDLDLQAFPVSLVFEKAVETLRHQADGRGISLDYTVPEELQPVTADANKITWVLTNLISNALRYTDSGGHIHLTAEGIGSKIHLTVTDDGQGIPYEYQGKIFDKFVQIGGERAVGGSGLGLAICREIVRAHGGRIWVDSTPGEGSTFTFTLPSTQ